ncbi:MAG: FtsH-binding integral membrane protein [Flavobacteriales bacterium]|jgi:FtsH-binding integral membrane protein
MEDQFKDQEILLEQNSSVSRSFVANVFSWMTFGLAVTAIVSYVFAHSSLIELIISPTGGLSILGWIVTIAPFGFILAMNLGYQKWSATGITALFIAFAIVMGMSLSTIFLRYTGTSIVTTFAIASSTFAVMAVLGHTTKTDLTKFGSLLYMALIGIVIAMVVNWFMQSSGLDMIISILGVLIFTGLIAYDTQKIKRIGAGVEYGSSSAKKLAILGATSLYLDFVNLFLFLLRLLGGRN